MLRILFHLLKTRFKFRRIVISITLLILYGCPSSCGQLYFTQGQDAHLTFPYPCDSTEVTLQHGHKASFYRLTDGQSLSSPRDQVQRLRVQNRNDNGNCSLDLTIIDVMREDEGTYILSVYKDGQILVDDTYRIYIGIEYPLGKASCVEVEGGERSGDWVAIECTANVGSLSGQIECYQNGEIMPSLNNPVETHTTLTQTIIVRKSQPAFCCFSTLIENKTRCECNDEALNLALDNSNYPCPSTSSITATATASAIDITEAKQTQSSLQTMASNTTKIMERNKCISVMIHSILLPFEIIVAVLSIIILYKIKQTKRPTGKDSQKSLLPT